MGVCSVMLLTHEQVEERIALYVSLREAMAEYAWLSSAMPENCPTDLALSSAELDEGVSARVVFVLRRAWTALRSATLADGLKKVKDAEEAVAKFETGLDV